MRKQRQSMLDIGHAPYAAQMRLDAHQGGTDQLLDEIKFLVEFDRSWDFQA